MVKRSNLDDPRHAAHAWRRYWRIMAWMALGSVAAAAAILTLLYLRNGAISLHFYIATAIGVILLALLSAGLMGLMFLSSGTGHDQSIDDPLEELHHHDD